MKHAFLMQLGIVLGALGVIGSAVFASPTMALGLVLSVGLVAFAYWRPFDALLVLAVYFPLEPFLMKGVSDQLFLVVRFAPEILLYVLAGIAVGRVLSKSHRPRTPIDLPFLLFLIVIATSIVINLLDPAIALIGTRQILRFMIVLFIVVYLHPSRGEIKRFTAVMLGVLLFEAGVGIAQALVGEPLDAFLFPSEGRFLGDITLTPNAFRFWDPGSRVFATMGRYDRLGTFLEFFLLIATGLLYELRGGKMKKELWILFALGLPALAMTYSRSGWFGFVIGFLLIGWVLKRDQLVKMAAGIFLIVAAAYVSVSGLVVNQLIDVPQQQLTERFFEAFSVSRWSGEYYGLGRLFWIVNTPLHVIPASPFFGHGPGQFGGGAVAALRNTNVYNDLNLPFGVAGTEGYVDNNWLSIWGETGTIGLGLYLWIMVALFLFARRVWLHAKDPFTKALALAFCGIVVAVMINAFLASFLEARTLAFYFWLYAGFIIVLGQKEGVELTSRSSL